MEGVYLEVDDAVATITIDRRDDENRLTLESLLRLKSIVAEVGDRGDIHAVVIRGPPDSSRRRPTGRCT
jgi:enoyl-CoA hydratase/carnithine racemase